MAKHFNKYFGTIAKNIYRQNNTKIKKGTFRSLKNQNLTLFLLSPATEKEKLEKPQDLIQLQILY